jgi:hypothetical protein
MFQNGIMCVLNVLLFCFRLPCVSVSPFFLTGQSGVAACGYRSSNRRGNTRRVSLTVMMSMRSIKIKYTMRYGGSINSRKSSRWYFSTTRPERGWSANCITRRVSRSTKRSASGVGLSQHRHESAADGPWPGPSRPPSFQAELTSHLCIVSHTTGHAIG